MFYPPLDNNVSTPYVYSFDLSTMTLTDKTGQSGDGQVVDLYDGSGNPLNVSGTNAENGIGSSPMLTNTSISNTWDTWGEAVTYRWDTGQDDWNKLAIVTPSGGGNALTFDKPLSLHFPVANPYDPATDDANGATSDNQPYTGQPLLLQYGGAGQLWGFPWQHDSNNDRWYSPITLKDGVVLTDGQSDYVVKGMEKEQHMTLTTARVQWLHTHAAHQQQSPAAHGERHGHQRRDLRPQLIARWLPTRRPSSAARSNSRPRNAELARPHLRMGPFSSQPNRV